MVVGKLHQSRQRCLLSEANDLEIAVMNPEDRRGLLADRSLVVGEPSLVRGADLSQFCPGNLEDLR